MMAMNSRSLHPLSKVTRGNSEHRLIPNTLTTMLPIFNSAKGCAVILHTPVGLGVLARMFVAAVDDGSRTARQSFRLFYTSGTAYRHKLRCITIFLPEFDAKVS